MTETELRKEIENLNIAIATSAAAISQTRIALEDLPLIFTKSMEATLVTQRFVEMGTVTQKDESSFKGQTEFWAEK